MSGRFANTCPACETRTELRQLHAQLLASTRHAFPLVHAVHEQPTRERRRVPHDLPAPKHRLRQLSRSLSARSRAASGEYFHARRRTRRFAAPTPRRPSRPGTSSSSRASSSSSSVSRRRHRRAARARSWTPSSGRRRAGRRHAPRGGASTRARRSIGRSTLRSRVASPRRGRRRRPARVWRRTALESCDRRHPRRSEKPLLRIKSRAKHAVERRRRARRRDATRRDRGGYCLPVSYYVLFVSFVRRARRASGPAVALGAAASAGARAASDDHEMVLCVDGSS